jgi:hypothetical protein
LSCGYDLATGTDRCEGCAYRRHELQTVEGDEVWDVIADCGSQLRFAGTMSQAIPTGLDFGAVLSIGTARGVDLALLSDVLPEIEGFIVGAWLPDDPDEGVNEDG